MNNQIGGNHYLKYQIPPITWALDNHINAAEFSILRYLLRYRDKNGLEDLDKATHYTQILMDQTFVSSNIDAIATISDFCIVNELVGYQHTALVALFDHDYIEVLKVIEAMKREFDNDKQ